MFQVEDKVKLLAGVSCIKSSALIDFVVSMALRQLSRFSSLHTIRAATGVSFKVPLVGTACPFSDQAGGKSTKLWGGRFARDTDAR